MTSTIIWSTSPQWDVLRTRCCNAPIETTGSYSYVRAYWRCIKCLEEGAKVYDFREVDQYTDMLKLMRR